jgi:hypothetical protein
VNTGDAAKLRRGMSLLVSNHQRLLPMARRPMRWMAMSLVAIGIIDYGKFLPKRVIVPAADG